MVTVRSVPLALYAATKALEVGRGRERMQDNERKRVREKERERGRGLRVGLDKICYIAEF